mmetsp:Transcript_1266/g.1310  ORF Transcript_1266/g.1310 Transcript_1266/m.1310 type:complete len:141 (+) Transcript_1266:734-1156(+)
MVRCNIPMKNLNLGPKQASHFQKHAQRLANIYQQGPSTKGSVGHLSIPKKSTSNSPSTKSNPHEYFNYYGGMQKRNPQNVVAANIYLPTIDIQRYNPKKSASKPKANEGDSPNLAKPILIEDKPVASTKMLKSQSESPDS